MSEQGTAATTAERPGTPGRLLRSAAVAAAAVALGAPTLGASAASAGLAPAAVTTLLGGASMTCGGLPVNPAALPGRPIRGSDRSGPAEGVSQVFRLSEWTRTSPYDGAHWSYVSAGNGAALLVATWSNGASRYIPVRERSDRHWQIDSPCTLQSR
jgi:hypothetical protein